MPDKETVNVPTKVWIPSDRRLDEFDNLNLDNLLGEGRAFLLCGTSVMQGRLVSIVKILKWVVDEERQAQDVKVWVFCKGHPKRLGYNGLHYIDYEKARKKDFRPPHASKVHIVTEVDPSLVEEGTDKRELQEVVDWALTQE